MRRLLLLVAAVALAAVPAVFGLTDNPALSHSVPVRIPSGAVPVTETHGGDSASVRHGESTSGENTSGKDTSGKDTSGKDTSGKDSQGGPATAVGSGTDRRGIRAPANVPRKDLRGILAPANVSGKNRQDTPAATTLPSQNKGQGSVSEPEGGLRGKGVSGGGGGGN